MRGEEVQIAGYLASNPDFDGVICLPGTHSKWVEVSAGEVVSFRTFLTGELFSLLSNNSVLRHSIGTGWDASAFEAAVSEAQSHPESLARSLFGLRAESLLADLPPDTARAPVRHADRGRTGRRATLLAGPSGGLDRGGQAGRCLYRRAAPAGA